MTSPLGKCQVAVCSVTTTSRSATIRWISWSNDAIGPCPMARRADAPSGPMPAVCGIAASS